MRKIMLVAAISFATGGLIGAYAHAGGADAKGQSSCPPKALKHSTTSLLRHGHSVGVPQECTNALLAQLYLQVHGMNAHLQTGDRSLETLEVRLSNLNVRLSNVCSQVRASC